MKKIFFSLLSVLFTISSSLAQGDGIQFTEGTWQEVLNLAKKENKLIFMDAYTSWCGPCKKMTKEIFPLSNVGSFYNKNFINVKMNMEKGEGVMLASQYAVIAYPTLLFINPDETLVHRVAGYHDADEFIALGATAVDPSSNLAAMKLRYEKGERNPEFLKEYTATRYHAMDGTHGEIAEAYLTTQKDWNTAEIREFIMTFNDQVDTPMFNYFVANRQAFATQFGEKEVVGKLQNLVHSHLYNQENISLEEVNELFKKVYPQKGTQLASHYRMTYYRNRGDREGFAKSAIDHYKKYPSKDASELNDIAWTFYEVIEDPLYLQGGIGIAKKAIKAKKAYSNLDTLAALYKKVGNKKKALRTAKKAIKLAKKQNEDYSLTETLLKEIEKM